MKKRRTNRQAGQRRKRSSGPAGADRFPPGGTSPVSQRSRLSVDPSQPIPGVTVRSRISHTAVFRKQVASLREADPGDLVAVYSSTDRLLGYALCNPRSEMTLRMMWWSEELPAEEHWHARLGSAVDLRKRLLQLDHVTDAYRIIHAESDGFPGLMVDRFGDVLSAETFSLGMYQRASLLLAELSRQLGTTHTIVQTSPQFVSQEGFDPPAIMSEGCPQEVVIQEYGTRFKVRFEGGHKTGFFCDQRDNRRMLADFCHDRTVLDLCCYTGGFAIQAMKLGNAREATGVDLDDGPLAIARENAGLNQVKARFVQSDVFNYMRDLLNAGRQFDVVVLDPPKLIRSRAEIEEGTRRHFDMNRLAMRLVRPGGLLLSCTCSGLLSESDFLKLLSSAARQAGPETQAATDTRAARHAARNMRIIRRTGAASDHPVGGNNPETDYLNAAWIVLD